MGEENIRYGRVNMNKFNDIYWATSVQQGTENGKGFSPTGE